MDARYAYADVIDNRQPKKLYGRPAALFVESKKYIAVARLRKRESSLEQFGLQVGSSGFCSDYHPDMIAAE
jgi:hypothetical protein